jgi:hypothetical protein
MRNKPSPTTTPIPTMEESLHDPLLELLHRMESLVQRRLPGILICFVLFIDQFWMRARQVGLIPSASKCLPSVDPYVSSLSSFEGEEPPDPFVECRQYKAFSLEDMSCGDCSQRIGSVLTAFGESTARRPPTSLFSPALAFSFFPSTADTWVAS